MSAEESNILRGPVQATQHPASMLCCALAVVMVAIALCLMNSSLAYAGLIKDNNSSLPQYDTSWYSSDKSTFTLTTAKELAGLARLVDEKGVTFKGKTIKLGSNIDLSSVCGKSMDRTWLPIGWINVSATGESTSSKWSFQGTFDGQGHTISNLYVDERTCSIIDPIALFGSTYNATIKDFTLKGESHASAGGTAAGVAGQSTGTTFQDITSNVDVQVHGNSRSAAGYAGGIVAYVFDDQGADSIFRHLINKGDVKGDCKYIGGIAGYLHMQRGTAYIYACSNEGKISGAESNYISDNYTGGVVGSTGNDNGSGDYVFEGCSNSGAVSGSGQGTGGIAGRLVGHSGTRISSSYNTGDISSSKDSGGIVGLYDNKNAVVSNSYNSGEVSGGSSTSGGIIGASGARIDSDNVKNNYTLRGTTKAYGTNAVNKGASNSGTSKSESEMKRKSFTNKLNEGVEDENIIFEVDGGYPVSHWQIYGFGDGDGDGGNGDGDGAGDGNGDGDGSGDGSGDGGNSGDGGLNDGDPADGADSEDPGSGEDGSTSPSDGGSAGGNQDAANDATSGSSDAQVDNIVPAASDEAQQAEEQTPVERQQEEQQQEQAEQEQAPAEQEQEESPAEEAMQLTYVEVEQAALDSALAQIDEWKIEPVTVGLAVAALLIMLSIGYALESARFRRRQPVSVS